MQFCERHWQALRNAIDVRGLTPYVAVGGKEAARRMHGDKLTAQNFEPLMGAHNAIVSHALKAGGIAIMAADCPICFLTAQHLATCVDPDCKVESYDDWVDKAADEALMTANSLGLPTTQGG